jgi:hypothetical protein
MIGKDNLIEDLLRRLRKLPVGECLEVRSYKRDRGFLLVRQGDDRFRLVEDGFEQADLALAASDLKRTLRTVVKREFPRSHKLRVYNLTDCGSAGLDLPRKRL